MKPTIYLYPTPYGYVYYDNFWRCLRPLEEKK